jgi:hypothetical protein
MAATANQAVNIVMNGLETIGVTWFVCRVITHLIPTAHKRQKIVYTGNSLGKVAREFPIRNGYDERE